MLLYHVASFMGAWIETRPYMRLSAYEVSHPLWVRGLKPMSAITMILRPCRILYGCVD